MADFDLTGAISSIVSNLGQGAMQYMAQAQQLKAAKAMAKSMSGGGFGGFPQLGTGNMRFGGSGMMYGFGGGAPPMNAAGGVGTVPYGPAAPAPSSTGNSLLDQFLGGLGFNYGSSAVAAPGAQRVRRPGMFMATDPLGNTVPVRTLGRPLLWSGDLAAFKRVRRIAGKLRKYSGHHPR
jgi:hypothetical protein